jgi:hypothetical protein
MQIYSESAVQLLNIYAEEVLTGIHPGCIQEWAVSMWPAIVACSARVRDETCCNKCTTFIENPPCKITHARNSIAHPCTWMQVSGG